MKYKTLKNIIMAGAISGIALLGSGCKKEVKNPCFAENTPRYITNGGAYCIGNLQVSKEVYDANRCPDGLPELEHDMGAGLIVCRHIGPWWLR